MMVNFEGQIKISILILEELALRFGSDWKEKVLEFLIST